MILKVFSVFDKAASAYLPPFYARSRGEAIRSFSNACTDQKHQFHSALADYVLFEVGSWDDLSGLFGVGEPQRVLGGTEVEQGS